MNHKNAPAMAALGELMAVATSQLAAAGIDQPRREARILLSLATGMSAQAQILAGDGHQIATEPLLSMLARRVRLEPMAYIAGHVGFWTLDLAVSEETLIPRADSEVLISALCEFRPERDDVRKMLDLGTGTGCLLLAAMSEFPDAFGVGVDLAPAAARLAHRNAQRCGMADRSSFLAGSWDDALSGRFDVVFSNPPYIPSQDIAGLMNDVHYYEPHRALDGGPDGLDAYRLIIARLPALLASGGIAILEIGIGQDESVPALGKAAGLHYLGLRQDLGGVPRAVILGAAD